MSFDGMIKRRVGRPVVHGWSAPVYFRADAWLQRRLAKYERAHGCVSRVEVLRQLVTAGLEAVSDGCE